MKSAMGRISLAEVRTPSPGLLNTDLYKHIPTRSALPSRAPSQRRMCLLPIGARPALCCPASPLAEEPARHPAPASPSSARPQTLVSGRPTARDICGCTDCYVSPPARSRTHPTPGRTSCGRTNRHLCLALSLDLAPALFPARVASVQKRATAVFWGLAQRFLSARGWRRRMSSSGRYQHACNCPLRLDLTGGSVRWPRAWLRSC